VNVWLIVILSVIYVMGLGFTHSALERIADHNNHKGGSFSGDYIVDMWCVLLWPLTWLLWLPAQLGKKVC
jgi:hypothetical protein